MGAYMNTLREEATREELLHEIERQLGEKEKLQEELKALLADLRAKDATIERFIYLAGREEELEGYRRAVGGAWCADCMAGNHSSQDSGHCGHDNRFAADCRCYHPDHDREGRVVAMAEVEALRRVWDAAAAVDNNPGHKELMALAEALVAVPS